MTDLEELDHLRRAIDRISGICDVPDGSSPDSPEKRAQYAEFLMRKKFNYWKAPTMPPYDRVVMDPVSHRPRVWHKRLAWNLVGVFVPYIGACALLGLSWKVLAVCAVAVFIANLVGYVEGRNYRP